MSKEITPSDVFVPGRFPLRPTNVYADRGSAQRELEQALCRGFVPIVYGSYGVGKSSLARFCTKSWESRKKLIYVESVYGKSLANIFERILEFLGYEVTVESHEGSEKQNSSDLGFEVSGGILAYLKAKVSGRIGRKRKKILGHRRELLIKSPTDSKILDICEENEICLLIDEVHRASDALRNELSAFLKAYANFNANKFHIGLIGTEIDASKLILRDPGIDRLLQEISVKSISPDEAGLIIYPGFEKLGLHISDTIAANLISVSVGSPFIVQYLCLEMAEKAISEKANQLTKENLHLALKLYTDRKAQRALRQYRKSIETVGNKRYRKQILQAMASCEDDYVTMDQIVRIVSEQLGEDVPSTALSGPLRQLKSDKYDKILTDVESSKEGDRLYNYSTFNDPAMKSIIRMLIASEEKPMVQRFFYKVDGDIKNVKVKIDTKYIREIFEDSFKIVDIKGNVDAYKVK